jgi:hypothetical protein
LYSEIVEMVNSTADFGHSRRRVAHVGHIDRPTVATNQPKPEAINEHE